MDEYEYDDETLAVFMKDQEQLFGKKAVRTPEEARELLEDCFAVICRGIDEVRDYMDESGMDVSELSDDDVREAGEVFVLSGDRYLVVLG